VFERIIKLRDRISSSIRNKEYGNGQIIALGGGGFSDQPDNLLLDEYILLQTNKSRPKVLFLPTAGGDHDEYIEKFYRAYRKFNCEPSHLSLSKEKYSLRQLENRVMSQDMIFVGGGSPRFLMRIWRKTGMIGIIKMAWREGIVLSGMSAGAICWYEDGFKNPRKDIWMRIKCLGFLEGSFCPHYDKRGELRKAFRKMILNGDISPGYGVQDGVALHYKGRELSAVISNVRDAKAFYVKRQGYRVSEKALSPSYLGILGSNASVSSGDVEIVREFINRINNHEIDKMLELVTEDITFIDSMGIHTNNKDNMYKAWDLFFTFFPDYRVNISEIISRDGVVAVFGKASGTLATNGRINNENRFEIPASWNAEITDGRISRWQVFADNEPVRKLIDKIRDKCS
jgi:dipeptidase E